MKRFALALLLALAPLSAMAADAIVLTTVASQSLYVRFYPSTSSAVAVALAPGSGTAARRYSVTDAAAVSAGLPASGGPYTYAYDVFLGATPSASSDDPLWGSGVLLWSGGGAITPEQALLYQTTSDTGANTIGRAWHNLRQSFASSTAGVYATPALANAPTGSVTLSEDDKDDIAAAIGRELFQPRINRKPDPAFTFKVSRRTDGTYVCTSDLRMVAGSIETVHPAIDMSPLFGPDNYVQLVGTPVISGGSLTVESEGPRDTYAFIQVDGTATASEARTITVPVTMTSGAVVSVKLNVKVFAE